MSNIIGGSSGNLEFKADIGTNTDWFQISQEDMTRRQVLLRHIWLLNRSETSWINNIFLLKATADTIMEFLNEDHEWKDRLEYKRKLWDIEFIDCSRSTLEDCLKVKSDEEFLLSFRENYSMNFYVVVVKRVKTPIRQYVRSM